MTQKCSFYIGGYYRFDGEDIGYKDGIICILDIKYDRDSRGVNRVHFEVVQGMNDIHFRNFSTDSIFADHLTEEQYSEEEIEVDKSLETFLSEFCLHIT